MSFTCTTTFRDPRGPRTIRRGENSGRLAACLLGDPELGDGDDIQVRGFVQNRHADALPRTLDGEIDSAVSDTEVPDFNVRKGFGKFGAVENNPGRRGLHLQSEAGLQ